MPSKNLHTSLTSFESYNKRIRNILSVLADVKPPKVLSEKDGKRYMVGVLKEFGII